MALLSERQLPVVEGFAIDLPAGLQLAIRRSSREITLDFSRATGLIARLRAPFDDKIDHFQLRQADRAIALSASVGAGRWALRLLPVTGEPMVQIVEVSSLAAGRWSIEFTGPVAHVQRQINAVTAPTDGQSFRFGGFSQHGQLANLKDWFFVERDAMCTGLLALRPSAWTHPTTTSATATGEGESLRLDFPHGSPRVRRSFLLAHVPAETALVHRRTGWAGFEPPEGYAEWPARQIARFGFARGERLASYAALSQQNPSRPTHFAFGDEHALSRAIERSQSEPDLLHNPLWAGNFAQAKSWMIKTLRQFVTALTDGGYLHPIGTPVAARTLGPAVGLFHMLDYLGHLTDTERSEAGDAIALLAELLFRRDFYPHDFAMRAPELPYTDGSFYRGMLNQNFNTDRYVFVGLAGCVLTDHPHAARWRRHAVEQFEAQMQAFVFPGGCWEESHTYANHVKMTLLPLVLALRHAPQQVDLLKNENFVATCRFFIPLLSPPDAKTGRRFVPAIGDHQLYKHDDFSCIFGWLATLCPERRDEFLWAWQAQGSSVGERASMQTTTFSPLLLPARSDQTKKPPALPGMGSLPGYGAFIRRNDNTRDESLLVVRCGLAWGHYHNDQGSFWWWVRGRLIACDAGLGEGPLKFAHHGHNVAGYVGHEPRQWMDRHPYQVDRCEQSADGSAVVRCQIPTVQWMHATELADRIPTPLRPHVTRTFEWLGVDELRITDAFSRSPDGLTTFSLHLAARDVQRSGTKQITFDLEDRKVLLTLPAEPKNVQFHREHSTAGVTCTYEAGTLVHSLHVG